MGSFTRYAAVAAVVLSLGFLATALPTIRADTVLPAITGDDKASRLCAEAFVNIAAAFNALSECVTLADVEAHIKICVTLLKACADDLLKLGAGVTVTVEAQASIAACASALIALIVKVCLDISVKFGLAAVVSIYAEIDVCLRVLLVNLDVCIHGIIALIVKALVDIDVAVLVKLHLNLCLSVLGLNVSL